MIKRLYSLALGAVLLAAASVSQAAGGAPILESHVNIGDRASLQRGAALFMNYCAGCHSLGFQRYSRTAKDLGLTEEQVMSYLNFTGAKFGEHMKSSMDPADGAAWFGKAPPDLSLVARAKPGGPDWTYTFLKSFYVDETRPAGWNNTVLVGSSMPNVLWNLQGTQRAVYGEHGEVTGFELAPAGSQSPEEFDRTIRDITAFLAYVGEPAALKREAYGVWVILFLTVFTFLAWLLKTEYWRDVH
ncbi:MAG: cytochrome c1 [Lysobacterales bacterium]|jgi:ubiquinol-cytochrome c reductase cytochrome c1 subunit